MQSSLRVACVGIVIALLAVSVGARTDVDRGINAFTVEQDVELGREAVAEVERELVLLRDREVTSYVDRIGKRLAQVSMLPDLPYTFKVVDAKEINAFALPGGYIYVNRGVIETAETESELAGVLAHEIGHVAARHGTNQVTKQMLISMPLQLFAGSIFDGDGGVKETVAKLGIGLGVSSVMLSYSRDAERQADILAVQELHDAGYEAVGMARFFQRLQEIEKREPSKLEQFFSSHPPPGDRYERVQREIDSLEPLRSPVVSTREFDRIKARLGSSSNDRLAERDERDDAWGRDERRDDDRMGRERRGDGRRGQYVARDGGYALRLPAGWRVTQESNDAVTFAVAGTQLADGSLEQGLIVRRIKLESGQRRSKLDDLAKSYIEGLRQTNPHLKELRDGRVKTRVDGEPALERVLRGRARGARYDEMVLLTIVRPARSHDEAFVILAVAPERDWQELEPAFKRALETFQLWPEGLDG